VAINGAGAKRTASRMMRGQVWPFLVVMKFHSADSTLLHITLACAQWAPFRAPAFRFISGGGRNLEISVVIHRAHSAVKDSRGGELGWLERGAKKSKVKDYFHGMRARLALAHALIPNPDGSHSRRTRKRSGCLRASMNAPPRPSSGHRGKIRLNIRLSRTF